MTAELFYTVLLRFYPKPFRLRFGAEMLQLFRDCYPSAQAGAFWLATLRDFSVSVPREWQRQVRRQVRRQDSVIDYTAIGDAIMVGAVVTPILTWWGWIATIFLLNLDAVAQNLLLWSRNGLLFLALATLAMGSLVGVLSTIAARRGARIYTTPWSKLANSGRITARFSR